MSPQTVYVAMSGGVDSSVAAALLQERGFRVIGVFMKPWQPSGFTCQWQQDREDAMRVATQLNIPLLTWDFSREYGSSVAEPLLEGYRDGTTPNPDVECNRRIKFGCFYERALASGANYVATGHYARITRHAGRPWLAKARDVHKDQTYFLWGIEPSCLEKTIFPVGAMTKQEVRRYASKRRFGTAAKKDSQGVCFVGAIDFRSFLKRHIPVSPGAVLDEDGRMVGEHDGAAYYTIGQRHGLGLPGGSRPQYVIAKQMEQNTITIGPEESLYGCDLRLENMNWFGSQPAPDARVSVMIRYRAKAVPATLSHRGRVRFVRPVRAISAGQSAVIYQGSRLVGGGIIT